MRTKLVIRMVGVSLLLEALMMFLSAAVAAFNNTDASMIPLLFSGLIVGVCGAFPQIFVREQTTRRITIREGYYIVVGSWVFACLFGTIPYLMYGGEFSMTNAIFESISGFTTTGASILNDVEGLPQGLLFWRMSTSWMGGIGIVALFSLVLPANSGNGAVLTGVEVSGIARDNAATREKSLVRMMVTTYLVLSVVIMLSLKLCGMRWFDAVCHAMSAVSTCGFSTKNANVGAFDSPLIEMVLSFFILVCSVNFILVYSLFQKGKQKNLFQSEVSRTYFVCVGVCIAIVCGGLFFNGTFDTFGESLRRAIFQVCTLVTTTGFTTVDCNQWPSVCVLVLMCCSIVCGCSGSTAGGMKFDRLMVCFKSVKSKLSRVTNPNQVSVIKVDSRSIPEDRVSEFTNYVVIYLLLIAFGSLVNSFMGYDLITAFSASVASIGNVGPGFNEVGTACNFANFPIFFKLFNAMLMLVGRLEVYSIFYVFGIRPRK